MLLNLLVQDVPDKLNELKVTNVTATTISLRWQLAFTGNAPVTSYLVQYQSDDPLDDLLMSGAAAQASSEHQPDFSSILTGLAGGGPASGEGARRLPAELEAGDKQPASGSLKAALEALGAGSAPNEAEASADEAIDRTLVELTVEQSATSLIVKDLSPFCVYRLRLAGINKIGLGEFSDWIRAKTEEAPPSGSALKISAAATGPNSVKLTWLPPDRRAWNGQLSRFNIGYRPIDSAFEFNKTVEWTPPSLQWMMQQEDRSKLRSLAAKQQQMGRTGSNATAAAAPATGGGAPQQQQPRRAANQTLQTGSLRQHLRQLLAQQQQELVAHLTNLQRSTTYLVWIQALNSRGPGPQSHAITVKTLDDVPPSAPALRVQSATPNSITIVWPMLSNFLSSANQYSLFYRRVPPPLPSSTTVMLGRPTINTALNGSSPADQDLAGAPATGALGTLPLFHEPGPFIERTITSQQLMLSAVGAANLLLGSSQLEQEQLLQDLAGPSGHQPSNKQLAGAFSSSNQQQHYQQFVYALDQLDCGSVYELYMITKNSVGKSEPSPVVTTRTLGEPPLAPANKNSLFARIGAQEVLLNLASWSTGGCPLTHITVRYKQTPAPLAAASDGTMSPATTASMLVSWPISTSVSPNLLAAINTNQLQRGPGPSGAPAAHLIQGGDFTQLAEGPHGHQLDSSAPHQLKNLQPSTSYELEIVAHNAAGHTTGQYEFVTAGQNGTRSGYTRREGVFRLDQRGQPVVDSAPSAANEHQFGAGPASGEQSTAGQLAPLLLSLICLVCLVVGSSLCYHKLVASRRKRQRRNSADTSRSVASCGAQSGPNLSPSSTIVGANNKSSLNWPRTGSATFHPHQRPHHPHPHHPHHPHHHHPHLQLATHSELDDQSPDSPPDSSSMHYCVRGLQQGGSQQQQQGHQLLSATLNPKSTFGQSVSMKDFNLVPGAASTLHNFKNCRSSVRPLGEGQIKSGTTLRARLFSGQPTGQPSAETEALQATAYGNLSAAVQRQTGCEQQVCTAASYGSFQRGGRGGSQPPVSGYGSTGSSSGPVYGSSHLNCAGVYPDQLETSWTTSSPAATTAAEAGQQLNRPAATTYAIPTAFQQDGFDRNQQQVLCSGQPDGYGPSSIDACIQQLMSQQQFQQEAGAHYAMLVNQSQKMEAGRCPIYAGNEPAGLDFGQQQQSFGKAAEQQQLICGGQSVVDSSSSSSGIGPDSGAHLECNSTTGAHSSAHLAAGFAAPEGPAGGGPFGSMASNNLEKEQQIELKQQV